MAKYYGQIGFASTQETSPGIWTEVITERDYYGDINKWSRRLSSGEGINDNVDISNTISILADPFVNNNLQNMRYITWAGSKWKVTSVDVEFPRMNLTLGGLYNEQNEN